MEEHTLQRALEEQAKGKFAEAKALLEILVSQSPLKTELLDQLAYVDMQLGLADEAKSVLMRAIEGDPASSPLLYVHLGQVYRFLKEFDDAKYCYEAALGLFPNSPELFYQLGMLHYQLGDYRLAENNFVESLRVQPDQIEAMYNLAMSLYRQGKKQEAVACLWANLEYDSRHVRSRFLLGKWLLEDNLKKDANQQFQAIVGLLPDDQIILGSIVKCFLEKNCFMEAKSYAQKYIELQPSSFDMHYNLGVIASKEGLRGIAHDHYYAALQIQPDYFPAIHNKAILYLEEQNVDAAKYYFNQAIQLDPGNESIRYTLNALSGEANCLAAPKRYIRDLFDQYADHFDQHLCEALDYCVPLKLKRLIEKFVGEDKPEWVILDLGCGTGLCGQHFKCWATRLIGVDLSPRMLEMAKQKGFYDELVIADNVEFLQGKEGVFNLIIAGDVFVYQGDLRSVFKNCANALKRDGLLIFSTEISTDKNFFMHPTGRFSHSACYINELAKLFDYQVLDCILDMTRIQGNEPLAGNYYVLQKR